MTHETRFAKTPDGVYLAYQVVGSAPVDVVMDLHALAGNVDLIWDEPDRGPMLAKIAEFARLIIHDRRGSGASTRNAPPPNLETRAADLLTVLDAVGSERPVLGAGASTGAMHALFAATYPDRTSGLLWNYPRPRLAWAPDYPWGQRPDAFEAALAEAGNWGTTEQAREQARNRSAQRQGVPHEQRRLSDAECEGPLAARSIGSSGRGADGDRSRDRGDRETACRHHRSRHGALHGHRRLDAKAGRAR